MVCGSELRDTRSLSFQEEFKPKKALSFHHTYRKEIKMKQLDVFLSYLRRMHFRYQRRTRISSSSLAYKLIKRVQKLGTEDTNLNQFVQLYDG